MKKLMNMIMALLIFVPFITVKAAENVYQAGEVVNFYAYEGDARGTESVILEDKGANDKYVKVLLTGFSVNKTEFPYKDVALGYTAESFETSGGYKALLDALNRSHEDAEPGLDALDGHAKPISEAGNLTTITLEELINVFGATSADGGETYSIDVAKWGNVFDGTILISGGFYTATMTEDKTQVWTVVFTRNTTTNDLEAINVVKKPVEGERAEDGTPIVYGYIPVVYMDKTYDCKHGNLQTENVCYDCGEDYVWDVVGSRDKECKVIGKITNEASCVKPPKTGINEYIIEFGAVAGICAIILIAIKKKDLFRQM